MNRIPPIALARFCGLYSGVVFGIYWIPLRLLENAGFPGMWSTAVFNLASTVVALPIMFWVWRRFFPGRIRFHLIVIGSGIAYVLYASAFLFTDIVSAIVLFYLMPVWGFILARIFIGDPITAPRWLSMVIAFAGLWVVLGQDGRLPVPVNIGDWMALFSGLFWAGMALMLLTDKGQEHAISYTAGFIFWGLIIATLAGWLATRAGIHPVADWSGLPDVAWLLLIFSALVIVPGAIATVYAPTLLNPGVVGLLFMTEISVGTITAAIWADEPFGTRQLIGVILITLAGALEPLMDIFRRRFEAA